MNTAELLNKISENITPILKISNDYLSISPKDPEKNIANITEKLQKKLRNNGYNYKLSHRMIESEESVDKFFLISLFKNLEVEYEFLLTKDYERYKLQFVCFCMQAKGNAFCFSPKSDMPLWVELYQNMQESIIESQLNNTMMYKKTGYYTNQKDKKNAVVISDFLNDLGFDLVSLLTQKEIVNHPKVKEKIEFEEMVSDYSYIKNFLLESNLIGCMSQIDISITPNIKNFSNKFNHVFRKVY